MKTFNGKTMVILFVSVAIIFCAVGLYIFRGVDPSLLDVTVIP